MTEKFQNILDELILQSFTENVKDQVWEASSAAIYLFSLNFFYGSFSRLWMNSKHKTRQAYVSVTVIIDKDFYEMMCFYRALQVEFQAKTNAFMISEEGDFK